MSSSPASRTVYAATTLIHDGRTYAPGDPLTYAPGDDERIEEMRRYGLVSETPPAKDAGSRVGSSRRRAPRGTA